jgi:hypothetical protein
MTQQPPQPPQPPPTIFNVELPADRVPGHYADFASIWHSNETFILDFIAMGSPPQPGQDDAGNPATIMNCQIVTRVRLPAEQVWEVMKALQTQLGAWEAENPHRKPPEPPL